jgi:hypothetical protein
MIITAAVATFLFSACASASLPDPLLVEAANAPIECTDSKDCEVKWSRALDLGPASLVLADQRGQRFTDPDRWSNEPCYACVRRAANTNRKEKVPNSLGDSLRRHLRCANILPSACPRMEGKLRHEIATERSVIISCILDCICVTKANPIAILVLRNTSVTTQDGWSNIDQRKSESRPFSSASNADR